jgi:uncharacterized membrane protein
MTLDFNKSVVRAIFAFVAFSIATMIVDVFQSRRLDALEKRLDVLEGHR